jgi:hypothetical protein
MKTKTHKVIKARWAKTMEAVEVARWQKVKDEAHAVALALADGCVYMQVITE